MAITPEKVWEFYDALRPSRSSSESQRMEAVVLRTDPDGTGWVRLPGSDGETPIDGTVIAGMEAGDIVSVSVDGGKATVTGNATRPSVGAAVVSAMVDGAVSSVSRAVDTIRNVASEAKNVAEAINQHFWTDGSGVHVSQETQQDFAEDGGPNILVNSAGVLLRDALNWLAQLTPGAVAFYDGMGNTASNLMASFGPTGVRQYVAGVLRSLLDIDGLTIYDAQGHVVGKFGDSARIGKSDSYVYINGYYFYFRDIDSNPAFLINSKNYSYDETKYIDPEQEIWPQVNPWFDFPFFVDSYTVTLDGGVDDTANWTKSESNGYTTITNYNTGTWETYSGRTLYFHGEVSEGAFVRNIITALGGYYLRDSTDTRYPGIVDNGTNLWIGARQAGATHHTGKTYISSGHNGTSGNGSIYVSVPNATNTNATDYAVYHEGNKPLLTSLSGVLATSHGGTGSDGYGSVKTNDISTAHSIATGVWTNIGSLSLGGGTWFVTYGAQFAQNNTGRRYASLSDASTGNPSATFQRATGMSANAVSSGTTYLHGSFITDASTIYLKVNQSSGNDLNVYGYMRAFRLK